MKIEDRKDKRFKLKMIKVKNKRTNKKIKR